MTVHITTINKALSDFIVRVASGKATSKEEVLILPEVARVLLDLSSFAVRSTEPNTVCHIPTNDDGFAR